MSHDRTRARPIAMSQKCHNQKHQSCRVSSAAGRGPTVTSRHDLQPVQASDLIAGDKSPSRAIDRGYGAEAEHDGINFEPGGLGAGSTSSGVAGAARVSGSGGGRMQERSGRQGRQPPKATFCARLQPGQLPDQAARQLADLSTIIRVRSSLTDGSRLRGALPLADFVAAKLNTSQLAVGRCSSWTTTAQRSPRFMTRRDACRRKG